MTWRDHTWEFTVTALSWFVAFGALGFVVLYVVYDAHKTRLRRRRQA